jgi:hypothetical protein
MLLSLTDLDKRFYDSVVFQVKCISIGPSRRCQKWNEALRHKPGMTPQLLISQGLLNDEQYKDKRNKVGMVLYRSESRHGTMPQ